MRKAQGLSMNVIIIAALALLVLIVIAMVFSSRFNVFGSGTRACSSKGAGATCLDTKCDSGMVNVGNSDNTDCQEGQVCCLPVYDG